MNRYQKCALLGEEFAGSERLGLAPKVLQNLGVLCERSSAGSLLCKRFWRTLLQNPKCSAEFLGGFWSQGPSFEDWLSFLPVVLVSCLKKEKGA